MPTEKFYKLDNEKRQKIINSMKKEFSKESFHDASINKIVEDAGISKGSFWVYFESKEEAIEYLIELHVENERKISKDIFARNNGDIFKSFVELYDYLSKESEEEFLQIKLMSNIFKSLIMDGEKCIHKGKAPAEDMLENVKIDSSNLNLKTEDDVLSLLKLLNYSMRINLIDVMSKKCDKKNARERFLKQVEILKYGVSKEKWEERFLNVEIEKIL